MMMMMMMMMMPEACPGLCNNNDNNNNNETNSQHLRDRTLSRQENNTDGHRFLCSLISGNDLKINGV